MLRLRLNSVRISLTPHLARVAVIASLPVLPAGSGTALARDHGYRDHGGEGGGVPRDHLDRDPHHVDGGNSGNSTAVAINTTDHSWCSS